MVQYILIDASFGALSDAARRANNSTRFSLPWSQTPDGSEATDQRE